MTPLNRYIVTVEETVRYRVPVSSRSEAGAMKKAETLICATRDRDKWVSEVMDRLSIDIKKEN